MRLFKKKLASFDDEGYLFKGSKTSIGVNCGDQYKGEFRLLGINIGDLPKKKNKMLEDANTKNVWGLDHKKIAQSVGHINTSFCKC